MRGLLGLSFFFPFAHVDYMDGGRSLDCWYHGSSGGSPRFLFSLLLISITWMAEFGLLVSRLFGRFTKVAFFPLLLLAAGWRTSTNDWVSRLDDLRMVRFRFYTLLVDRLGICLFFSHHTMTCSGKGMENPKGDIAYARDV